MKFISRDFNTRNKKSIKNLHEIISSVDEGLIPQAERDAKEFGENTVYAIEVLIGESAVEEGRLRPEAITKINDIVVRKKYDDEEQVASLHKNFSVLNKKKFIDKTIAENELQDKEMGASTHDAIQAFQKKYKLNETGEINAETDERLTSVITSIAGSKPKQKKNLKVKSPVQLKRTVRFLRLNMSGEKVNDLQRGLAWLGYPIVESEFKKQTFGKSTQDAIKKIQAENDLFITGEVDSKTSKLINFKLSKANPVIVSGTTYRVRGSVRDELWEGMGNVTVQIFEKGLRGPGELLGQRTTFQNGFFDIVYTPPAKTQVQDASRVPLHIIIKFLDENQQELASKTYSNVQKVLWANYTQGDSSYLGDSEFQVLSKVIGAVIAPEGLSIVEIEESENNQDIAHIQRATGIHPHQILSVSLAHRVAESMGQENVITPEVVYALLRQNLPPELPSDIFPDRPDEWSTWIPPLVEKISNGIAFLDESVQQEAIELAVENNLVSRQVKPQQANIASTFTQLKSDFVLSKPLLVGDGRLNTLLNLASFDSSEQEQAATLFFQNQGINEAFWNELDGQSSLTNEKTTAFKNLVDIGTITKNYIPLLTVLFSQINDSQLNLISSSRDFAKFGVEDWKQLIQQENTGIPDNIDGANAADKLSAYATTLYEQAELLFPDIALVAEIGRHSEHGLSHVNQISNFIDQNEDFSISKNDITKFNLEAGDILSEEALQEFRAIQRIHRITLSSTVGTVLLNAKFHSSAQIYFTGRDRFLRSIEAAQNGLIIDKQAIYQIYANAEHQYAHILAKIAQYRFDFFKDNPLVLPNFFYSDDEVDDFKQDIPNLETLFGSIDFCECEHCSSIYSPAAYLTDLLRFLEEKDAVNAGDSVQDVLLDRRPDIANIKLNCDNTHTPLPYIDLVNEILENAIPPENSDFSYQSTLSAAELKAVPEHIRPHAYDHLKEKYYPMSSAFNLWQEETRLFLQHLGVPRHELMRAFQNQADPNNLIPINGDIAAEYFGISSQEKALILPTSSQANPTAQTEFWDFNSTSSSIPVSTFLKKSQLTYTQLLDLLQVQWANPNPDAMIIDRPVDDCDVEKQDVINITVERLDAIHRFLRLWRRTGWEMWELDLLLRNTKLGNGDISDPGLYRLMQFHQLQEKLSLDVEALLALFGDINTELRADSESTSKQVFPLYHRLFQNLVITNPLDNNFSLPLVASPLEDHSTTILSALTIEESTLSLLTNKTDGQLSLESLSILYRYTVLAKALRLSSENLQFLLDTVAISDPFTSIQQVWDLIEAYQEIKDSKFSLHQLHYVLTLTEESPVGLREEVVTQYVELLRNELSTLHNELFGASVSDFSPSEYRTLVEKHLGRVIGDNVELVQQMLDLMEGIWDSDDATRLTFIDDHFSQFIPSSANPNTNLTQESYWDDDELSEAEETAINARYRYVIKHLYNTLNENTIKAHISNYLQLESDHADFLLDALAISVSGDSLLKVLQDDQLIDLDSEGEFSTETSEANFGEAFYVYRLLHKISIVLENISLDLEELTWFLNHHSTVGALDLSTLPISAVPGTPLYPAWEKWVQLLQFKDNFPAPEETSLYQILELASDSTNDINTIYSQLASLTQWDESELIAVAEGVGLQHTATQLDYTQAENIHRLWDCFKQLRLTGVSASSMFGWAQRTVTSNDQVLANHARHAAKSKYGTVEWLGKVQPIQDELREKQRAALVAFLMEHSMRNELEEIAGAPNPKYFENTFDLFNYFLIDVEMSACQFTSRLRQAISAVQLFVQRCILNLESHLVQVPNVDPDELNSWSHWTWMKNYRVWEANRKVFLYPENWIEPELRDDKSPFFKELESDLLQNEVNEPNVERAFLNYLNKVDEVAQLEIMGMYHENNADIEQMHVIGRTKNHPHTYFYRTFNLDYFHWTAWEQIDVDIVGDHPIPVIFNRKLHIFWLVFTQTPEKIKKNPGAGNVQGSGDTADNPEAAITLEIQLAWSAKNHDGWSPKQLSAKKLIHPWERPQFAYHLKPRYKSSDNSLWVDLFVSSTREFNNNHFYHQYKADKFYRSRVRYNQGIRPWHSSSFVFNGDTVTELKLRGIWAKYYDPSSGDTKFISSQQFVSENFDEEGRAITLLTDSQISGRLLPATGMHFNHNRLQNRENNTNNLYIEANSFGSKNLLTSANAPFKAVIPMQSLAKRPLMYQDNVRAFFIKPEWKEVLVDYHTKVKVSQYVFYPMYHPYTDLLIQELNRSGVEGILNRKIQIEPQTFSPQNFFNFNNDYSPVSPNEASEEALQDRMDFSFSGAYSIYNWELFFHAPMLIAGTLSQNQKFEQAMRWYHYIFNPTNTDDLPSPQRYWITKPFYEHSDDDYRTQRIENILQNIDEFADQVAAWKNDPFKPHLIARYRPVAYQRNVVMKYINNLISWGDQLFRRDTMESINEASLLYLLAYEILGPRAIKVPSVPREDKSFNEFDSIDIFSNSQIEVAAENELGLPISVTAADSGTEPLPRLETFYFCIPNNSDLSKYWDTVEDRLFKIRNCMNITGIVRQLPLFAPPIDPTLLVKAAAAGADLSSILSDLSAPTPCYRFRILVQVAHKFATEVKSLGDNLLSILEKRDSESLAVLRSTHEISLLEAVKELRELQLTEAEEEQKALEKSKEVANERSTHYAAQPRMNASETFAEELNESVLVFNAIQAGLDALAGLLNLIPSFNFGGSGVGGSPHVTASWGGPNLAGAISGASSVFQRLIVGKQVIAAKSEKQGTYTRQFDNNQLQMRIADKDMEVLDQQIVAAEVRKNIAAKEINNQELEIENAKAENDFLHNKYTNEELYNWMLTQASTTYFQAYQIAYDMAKSAEKSFQHELGIIDTSYIQFGYWDSLRKGLLSGDKLMTDLHRMEAAYYDLNKRSLELTKHVSLRQFFPKELMQLVLNGTCQLSIPEWLFNMDYPGHYMRRIKSVSITIPCITGPYTGVHCTLSLTSSEIRVSNLVGSGYEFEVGDTRRRELFGATQSIATSHAQDDSGMFILNFEDDRFLPFEGMGAVSNWKIDLPHESNLFDFDSISDVVLHIQYMAKDGGSTLASAALEHLNTVLPQEGMATLSLKQQLPTEWHRFIHPDSEGNDQELVFNLLQSHYPFYASSDLKIANINLLVFSEHSTSFITEIQLPGQPSASAHTINPDAALDNTHHLDWNIPSLPSGLGNISLKIRKDTDTDFQSLSDTDIDEIVLIIQFQ